MAETKTKPDREDVAALCHSQWSGWMEYLFSQSMELVSGSVVIPRNLVHRWKRQIKTPYADLSDSDKESDRKEADKFLALMVSETKS